MPYLLNDIYELLINNICKHSFFTLKNVFDFFLMITYDIFRVIEFQTKPLLKMVEVKKQTKKTLE